MELKNQLTIKYEDFYNLTEKQIDFKKIIISKKDFLKLLKERNDLFEKSNKDPLTKVYNRRGFYLLVNQQIKLIKRKQYKAYLWYFDLNDFKKINDTLGHKCGDKALIIFATILKSSFRESDIIGRLGGDEFVVFTINGHQEIKKLITLRLKNKLKETNNRIKNYNIIPSVGVSEINFKNFINLENSIKEADELMYEDKRRYKQK